MWKIDLRIWKYFPDSTVHTLHSTAGLCSEDICSSIFSQRNQQTKRKTRIQCGGSHDKASTKQVLESAIIPVFPKHLIANHQKPMLTYGSTLNLPLQWTISESFNAQKLNNWTHPHKLLAVTHILRTECLFTMPDIRQE